jgi:hypothetical protein
MPCRHSRQCTLKQCTPWSDLSLKARSSSRSNPIILPMVAPAPPSYFPPEECSLTYVSFLSGPPTPPPFLACFFQLLRLLTRQLCVSALQLKLGILVVEGLLGRWRPPWAQTCTGQGLMSQQTLVGATAAQMPFRQTRCSWSNRVQASRASPASKHQWMGPAEDTE